MDENNIKHYVEHRARYANHKRKGIAFAEAISKCDEYIRDPEVSISRIKHSICVSIDIQYHFIFSDIPYERKCLAK